MIIDYYKMIKHHGLINGSKRFYEEITENRLFDIINKVDTSKIVTHDEYFNMIKDSKDSGAMWYQPTYSSPLKNCMKFIDKKFLKKSNAEKQQVLFIDLGVGKGKPCIIANKYLNNCKVVGIDLSENLLKICEHNLSTVKANYELICKNVLEIDFKKLFTNYDFIIIHNKNSFDESITAQVYNNILKSKSKETILYIYNNPVYETIFSNEEVLYKARGWHKNLNLDLYNL